MVREITQRFHLILRKLYYNALKRPKLLPWVPLHVDPFDFWGDKRDLPTLLPFHVILFLISVFAARHRSPQKCPPKNETEGPSTSRNFRSGAVWQLASRGAPPRTKVTLLRVCQGSAQG